MKNESGNHQRFYADDLETDLGRALTTAGIPHTHESECPGQRLDFFLPEDNLYIEIKRYHSPRIATQAAHADNIIFLQGKPAVDFFIKMISKNS